MNYLFRWMPGSSPGMTYASMFSESAAVACGVDARLHGHQRGLVAIAADDVHELGRVCRQPLPAIRLRYFTGVALVETHAGEHAPACRFDPRGQAHAIGVGLDLRAGDNQQRDGGAAA